MADERRVVKTDNQKVGENDTDINERRIFVGGIDAGITENDLQNYFAQYGEIDYVDIKRDHNTGHVRGFCFVIFQNADSVQKAIEACDQHTIKGVEISVVKAISRRDPFPGTERIFNDDMKIFVGGLTNGIAEKELKTYFCQYGDVETVDIKANRYNDQQRGFAFVVFRQTESVGKALADCPHVINGEELCVVKAKNRSAKIFVGGFTSEISYDDIKTHFSKFGIISDISIPIDKETNQRKSYCFITFDSEQNAREALRTTNQTICGVEVGVRTAIEKGDDAWRTGYRYEVGSSNNAPGLLGPPPVFGVQQDSVGSRRFDRVPDLGGSRRFDRVPDLGGSRRFDRVPDLGGSRRFDRLPDLCGSRGFDDGLRYSGGSRGFHGSINVYTAPNCNPGFGRERSDRSNWRDWIRESQLNWRYPDRQKGGSTSWRSNNPAHK